MDPLFFHIAFAVLFLVFLAIRANYQRAAVRARGKSQFIEGTLHQALSLGAGLLLIGATLLYIVRPETFSWAVLPFPEWVRWVGLVLSVISLLLLWWVHASLGSNFSSTLHIREEHSLVTYGPYRWVRHPMYTVLLLYLAGNLLLTSNWLVGGLPLVALALIVIVRLGKEETVMTEKFGDQYRQYMARTGRLLPSIGSRQTKG